MTDVKIEVLENGPYIVEGPIELTNFDGKILELPAGRKTYALCRCGASVNKPFCDGTHSKIGFKGAAAAVAESEKGE
jgi:CDGSH-type Zn-finger protein